MSARTHPVSPWPGYMSAFAARQSREYRHSFAARPDLVPVIVGNDVNAYATARCMHQSYGCRVSVISDEPIPSLRSSRFINLHLVADLGNDDVLIKTLKAIAHATADANRVLLGTFPGLVCFLFRHGGELTDDYAFPRCDFDATRTMLNKAAFATCCATLNVPAPFKQLVDIERETPASFDMPFPVVATPSVWHLKQARQLSCTNPVTLLEGPSDAVRMWRKLESIGYDGDVVIEPVLRGDESHTSLLSFYVNSRGNPTLASSFQVLLHSPAPVYTGQHLALLTQPCDPELVEHGLSLLKRSGYRGFVTFVIRKDPTTGQKLFVDALPTGGRYSFTMQLSGVNPLRHLVADLIDGADLQFRQSTDEHIVSAVPTWFLLRRISNPHLRRKVWRLAREGRVSSPLIYPVDQSVKKSLLSQVFLVQLMYALERGRSVEPLL